MIRRRSSASSSFVLAATRLRALLGILCGIAATRRAFRRGLSAVGEPGWSDCLAGVLAQLSDLRPVRIVIQPDARSSPCRPRERYCRGQAA